MAPILKASERGDLGVVNLLLTKVPQAVKTTDQAGRTALHWASRCGDLDLRDQLVSLLTSKGADKNAKDSVNCSASSFLYLHHLDFRMGTYLNTTSTMISLTRRDNLPPMKIPSQRVILCK